MLVHKAMRLVIITPPKCGTKSAEHEFPKWGWEVVANSEGCPHEVEVPDYALGWRRYMFVRNPYERAISLWKHYRDRDDTVKDSFETRANFLLGLNDPNCHPFNRSLARWHLEYGAPEPFHVRTLWSNPKYERRNRSRMSATNARAVSNKEYAAIMTWARHDWKITGDSKTLPWEGNDGSV